MRKELLLPEQNERTPISPLVVDRAINRIPLETIDGPKYFEEFYGGVTDYGLKYDVACAIVEDGRYKNLRFLMSQFIPRGEEEKPEAVELRDDLRAHIREVLLKRGDGLERRKAEEDLANFTKEVAEGKTLDAQQFKQLVGLFGSSRVVDILYRSRPEFRGLPVDRVKHILAEYLGDYLVSRGGFNLDDVEVGLQYLSDQTLREGLVEVVKDSSLTYYLQTRKQTTGNDQSIFQEYIDGIREETAQFGSDELDGVVSQVEEYYRSIFEDIKKPEGIVNQLKSGRAFPDIGQLINIKEISDKKRVLIADEMGLGKSASAILAKELLGIGRAVIVAPSNVISTWQDYLSDKISPDGKQIGYFKPGQAPRVLVVENHKALQNADASSYDYILLSQERLNTRYTQELIDLGFGMLIVDEVHKLKNLKAGKRAQSLIELSQSAEGEDKYLALLSGTPVPNKVQDIAMSLKLLYPERFKNIPNKDLVRMIINGDYVDLRRLLIPRMQMKSLAENIEMPGLTEEVEYIEELSPQEREIYEILLEEDEIEARDKIRVLRQFLLNPELLDITPGVEGSKIKKVRDYLQQVFQDKDKVVMFVNDYIEDVIRGEKSILPKLNLPLDVEIRVIHGENKESRQAVQEEFRTSTQKMLLVVSGGTADVGVDFSPAEEVIFYNQPWTKYDQRQQRGRAYREGLEHPLKSTTFICRNTIEDGINYYIEAKYKAVEKLLRGIPITELEKELLEATENQSNENLEVNPELARYYFSSWDRMVRIFAHVKEIGEEDFVKFLSQFGKDYAECYLDLGRRSYQANASRVSGTLINNFARANSKDPRDLRILDLASGPEMLKRHMPVHHQDQVYSVDINRYHFTGKGDRRIVGSFLNVPIADNSFDYVNLGLALHYAKFIPSREDFERLEVLREVHRVLKQGGRAVLNLIYTLDLRDLDKFREIAEDIGFRVVDECSGEVDIVNQYHSRVITLEKQEDFGWSQEELIELIGKENFDGLKMRRTDKTTKDSRRVLREFTLARKTMPVSFNEQDFQVVEEEETINTEGEGFRERYGDIKDIPEEEIVQHNFVRILIGKRYVLFKRLKKGEGVVVIK